MSVDLVASLLNTTTSMFNQPMQINLEDLDQRKYTWREAIELEQKLKVKNEAKEKRARAVRLARLFRDSIGDSDDDLDILLD